MTRSGTMKVEADPVWEERVLDFLHEQPTPEPAVLWDLTAEKPPRFESDPLFEKPPRCWREKLRWIWRAARWPWWNPPIVEEAERWELSNVTFYSVSLGSPPDDSADRMIPFTWSKIVLSKRGLDRIMRSLYGPAADSWGMGV